MFNPSTSASTRLGIVLQIVSSGKNWSTVDMLQYRCRSTPCMSRRNFPSSDIQGLPRPDPLSEVDSPSYQILENTLYTTIRCNVLKCFLQICPIIETWYGVDCLHLVCLSHFQAHPISCQFLNFFLFVSVRWLIDIVSFWEHIKILSLYFLHRVYTFVSNVYVLNSFAILWHFENVHMFSLFAKSWSIALSADLAKPFSRQRLPANTDVYIYFICSYSRSCTTVDMQKASSSSFIWSGRQIAF